MNVQAPYGLRTVAMLAGRRQPGALNDYPVLVNNTVLIRIGDPVALAAGGIVAVTATPTPSAPVIGVCDGFFYYDNNNVPVEIQYLSPGSVASLGYKNIVCHVTDDPDALFYVQGNAAGPYGPANFIGRNAPLVNFGSTGAPQNSQISLDVGSVAVTATLAMRIVRVDRPEDTYPDIVVGWTPGVHAYEAGLAT
jgi:hypothetical protein